MEQYKTCTKCGQAKLLTNFSKHNGKKSSKLGVRSTCKQCDVESNRKYREANRDKVRAAKRKYAENNKDKKAADDKKYREKNKEKIAIKNKEWRLNNYEYCQAKGKEWRSNNKELKALADKLYAMANKDKVLAASRRWRANNPEKAKEVAKNYRNRNPEAVRNKASRRRAVVRQNGIFKVTKKDILKILRNGCFYCGAKAEHIDHIVPISRGGTHGIGNLTGACARCNLSKGAKFITEWKK